jgi:hypothetical protein
MYLLKVISRKTQSEAWIRGSGSTPKSQGSGTLHFVQLQIDSDLDPVPDPDDHFDADPDPDFYLMRIRILILIKSGCGSGFHNDADPCGTGSRSGSTTLFHWS